MFENFSQLGVAADLLAGDDWRDARDALKRASDLFLLAACHAEKEKSVWLLNHQCQGLAALQAARDKLGEGLLDDAREAYHAAVRELKKGHGNFYKTQEQTLQGKNSQKPAL